MYVATRSASACWWFVKIAASGSARKNVISASTIPARNPGRIPTAMLRRMSAIRPSTRRRGIIRVRPVSAPSSQVFERMMKRATATKKAPASLFVSAWVTTTTSANWRMPFTTDPRS